MKLFEGLLLLLLLDMFVGFVVAVIGIDWGRAVAVCFEKQWMLVAVLVAAAVTSSCAMLKDRPCSVSVDHLQWILEDWLR